MIFPCRKARNNPTYTIYGPTLSAVWHEFLAE